MALRGRTKGADSAYPLDLTPTDDESTKVIELGISKREYFAAMAMQGLIAYPDSFREELDSEPKEQIVQVAVQYADALIEALNI